MKITRISGKKEINKDIKYVTIKIGDEEFFITKHIDGGLQIMKLGFTSKILIEPDCSNVVTLF